jgi:uncharacterized protein (TIGR00255 family)
VIFSMTGFGRDRFEVEGAAFDVEVRSVNHRYLDVRVRLPRPLAAFEAELRTRVQSRFDRGKVDLSVQMPSAGGAAQDVEVDLEAVARYLEAAATLRERHGLSGDLDVDDVLGLPGVARFVEHELPREALREALFRHADVALEQAAGMRRSEGEALEREIRGRLDRIAELAEELAGRAADVQEHVRERLGKRAEALAQETGVRDEGRLLQEIVLAADRMDITEEIVRLRSHVDQFRASLDAAGPGKPVGRRLDFLLQELGREANTVGSKGSDAPIAHRVVELKTELERVREQVQNVE